VGFGFRNKNDFTEYWNGSNKKSRSGGNEGQCEEMQKKILD
jgi:hypothetical protein